MMRVAMKVDVPKIDGLKLKLDDNFRKIRYQFMEEWSKWIVGDARRRARAQHGDRLANDIVYWEESNQTYKVGFTGRSSRYGRYLERGFRKHVIPVEYMGIHNMFPGQKGTPARMRSMGYSGSRNDGPEFKRPSGYLVVEKAKNKKGYMIGPAVLNSSKHIQRLLKKAKARTKR